MAVGRVIAFEPVFYVLGGIFSVLSFFMLPSLVIEIGTGSHNWVAFLRAMIATSFVGIGLLFASRQMSPPDLSGRQAFFLTTLVWTTMPVFSALPFYFSDAELTTAEAIFEAVSGLTTTGSTVMTGLENQTAGLLMWRAMLQWLGGIGIIVLGIAILPFLKIGGMQLLRTESSDSSDKILPRAGQIAANVGSIYALLTMMCAIAYWSSGMSIFDAVTHAMTTVATGGFSNYDASFAQFTHPVIQWIAIVFMILASLPFILYIRWLNGRYTNPFTDPQVVWFLGILTTAIMLTLMLIWPTHPGQGFAMLSEAAFSVVSVMTGTGYAVTDYGLWGPGVVMMMFFLMMVGGCTGSTTGGIKIFRVIMLNKVARLQISRTIRPNGIFQLRFHGRPLPEAAVASVTAFVALFGLSFAFFAILLAMTGLDFVTASSSAMTALANVGPGLGPVVGPSGNFSSLTEPAKWLMSAAMLLGRLELLTVFVLFSPNFWRL